jgi:hypothetical protein
VEVHPELGFKHVLVEIAGHPSKRHFKEARQVERRAMLPVPVALRIPLLQAAVKDQQITRP